MAGQLPPLPAGTPLVQKAAPGIPFGMITNPWVKYLQLSLVPAVESAPQAAIVKTLTTQNASIGTTPFALGSVPAGLYRVSYYARVTTAAATSSSLTVTLSWTDGAVPCAFSGAALTSNTTASIQSNTILIRSDAAGAINYATTYASNAAGQMVYRLDLIVEVFTG